MLFENNCKDDLSLLDNNNSNYTLFNHHQIWDECPIYECLKNW